MWSRIERYFSHYPGQEKVARLLLQYGCCIRDGSIYCGEVKISLTAMGRAAGVDRRVVMATIDTIEGESELRDIFARLLPFCHLKNVTKVMAWGALGIMPTNASQPGILADVARIIADAGISIRQVVADDPDLSDVPRAFIITEDVIPYKLLPKIRAVNGIESVIIH